MPVIYLILSVIGCAAASVLGSIYNRQNSNRINPQPFYSLIKCVTVFVFWSILFLTNPSLDWSVLVYAIIFGVGYATASYSMVVALKKGPVVLTSLILQMSLIGTTIWGFIFWNSPFSFLVVLGLVLIVIALILCLYTKDKEDKKISLVWFLIAMLAFLGNVACTISQKTQQMDFNGEKGNFFMMIATFISTLISLGLYLKGDKKDTKVIAKTSIVYPVGEGVLNGVMNVCVMLLATSALSPSLIYPFIAVAGLSVSTIFSMVVLKEKMYWWQWVGVGVGAVAVAILSI